MELYVVINTDCGWDNIVGIFDKSKVTQQELEEMFSNDAAIIIMDWHKLQTDLSGYEQ